MLRVSERGMLFYGKILIFACRESPAFRHAGVGTSIRWQRGGGRMNVCEPKVKKNNVLVKAAGIILMIAGILVILFCVPMWFWSMLLGAALAAIGFLIWRFCG